MEKKITKRNVLMALATVIADDFNVTVGEVTVTADDVRNYIDTTIEQLDKKAESAAKRAADKRAEGDELRAKIAAVLTDEYKTIADIIAAIGDEDLTPGKVTARLTQLVKLQEAHKTKVKKNDRQVMAYAAGPAPEAEAVDAE